MKINVFGLITVKLLLLKYRNRNEVKFWKVFWSKDVNWLERKTKVFKLAKPLKASESIDVNWLLDKRKSYKLAKSLKIFESIDVNWLASKYK
jgi:hypothetical protein